MNRWIKGLLVVAALGCGGETNDSGVPADKKLVALSDGEVSMLCVYLVELGPDHTVDCGNGLSIPMQDQAACVADADLTAHPDCTATVDDVEACAEAMADYTDAQRCSLSFPQACAPLFAEACSGIF